MWLRYYTRSSCRVCDAPSRVWSFFFLAPRRFLAPFCVSVASLPQLFRPQPAYVEQNKFLAATLTADCILSPTLAACGYINGAVAVDIVLGLMYLTRGVTAFQALAFNEETSTVLDAEADEWALFVGGLGFMIPVIMLPMVAKNVYAPFLVSSCQSNCMCAVLRWGTVSGPASLPRCHVHAGSKTSLRANCKVIAPTCCHDPVSWWTSCTAPPNNRHMTAKLAAREAARWCM